MDHESQLQVTALNKGSGFFFLFVFLHVVASNIVLLAQEAIDTSEENFSCCIRYSSCLTLRC